MACVDLRTQRSYWLGSGIGAPVWCDPLDQDSVREAAGTPLNFQAAMDLEG